MVVATRRGYGGRNVNVKSEPGSVGGWGAGRVIGEDEEQDQDQDNTQEQDKKQDQGHDQVQDQD